MSVPDTKGWRVKLYQLNDSGQWDDRGTGFCSCIAVDDSRNAILIKSEDDENEVLLHSFIVDNDVYQRQGHTIITFKEPQDLVDLAMSFQEEEGCQQIWSRIAEVQGKFSSDFQSDIQELQGNYESEEDYGMDGIEFPTLPTPEISSIPEIVKLFSPEEEIPEASDEKNESSESTQTPSRGLNWKVRLAGAILQVFPTWIEQLFKLFRDAEDIENIVLLEQLAIIMKGICLLNDAEIFERLLSDDFYLEVVGILEYDSDNTKRVRLPKMRQITDPSPPVSPTDLDNMSKKRKVEENNKKEMKDVSTETKVRKKNVNCAANDSSNCKATRKLNSESENAKSKAVEVEKIKNIKESSRKRAKSADDIAAAAAAAVAAVAEREDTVDAEILKLASKDRPKHREFLQKKAKFKQVVPVKDEDVLFKIHQTYRLTYLRDVVLLNCLDDCTVSTLSALIHLNNNYILMKLQDPCCGYLNNLYNALNQRNLDPSQRSELLVLLRTMCQLAKNLQQDDREAFYRSFYQAGSSGAETETSGSDNVEMDTDSTNSSSSVGTGEREDGVNVTPASSGASTSAADDILSGATQSTSAARVAGMTGGFLAVFERLLAIGNEDETEKRKTDVKVAPLSTKSRRCCIDILACVVHHNPQLLRKFVCESTTSCHPAAPQRGVKSVSGKNEMKPLSLRSARFLSYHSNVGNENHSNDSKTEKWPSLLWLLVSLVVGGNRKNGENRSDDDDSMGSEAIGILHSLLDSDSMDPGQRDSFLPVFYNNYMDWLMQPFEAIDIDKCKEPQSEKATKSELCELLEICELLRFCVQHHSFRIKYFILRNNVVSKILRLLHYRERYLICTAVRFVRACIGLQDEFYNRYLIKNNLLEPIFEAWQRNGNRDNLLESIVLELSDFVRNENVKSLVSSFVESAKIKKIFTEKGDRYVEFFEGLVSRHDQNVLGKTNTDSTLLSNGSAYDASSEISLKETHFTDVVSTESSVSHLDSVNGWSRSEEEKKSSGKSLLGISYEDNSDSDESDSTGTLGSGGIGGSKGRARAEAEAEPKDEEGEAKDPEKEVSSENDSGALKRKVVKTDDLKSFHKRQKIS
eukprot:g2662.t1